MKNKIIVLLCLVVGSVSLWATQPVGQAKQPSKRAMWKAVKQQIRQMESTTFFMDSVRCDWMELENGSRFQVQVLKMTEDSIKYRFCKEGLDGSEQIVALSAVKSLSTEKGEAYYQKKSGVIDKNGNLIPELHPKNKKWAAWSLGLGIFAVGGIIIPFVGILSLPAAIVALVLGLKSRNDSKSLGAKPSSKATTGIILSYVYFGILILATLLVLLILLSLA